MEAPCQTLMIGFLARRSEDAPGMSTLLYPLSPDRTQILRAIDLFVEYAYADGAQPGKSMQSGLADLRGRTDDASFFASPLFLRPTKDTPVASYTLRLGNRFYPHMKLVIQPSPDGTEMMYRADTHDRHLCPATGHPEYQAFMELRARNQQVAEAIEAAWAVAGICTFKTYLQNDLRRRRERQATAALGL